MIPKLPSLSPKLNALAVIVTIRDDKDYIRVHLYSYYTTITEGVLLLNALNCDQDPEPQTASNYQT